MRTIKVQLVDDLKLVETGLRALLDSDPQFEVVGRAHCSSECGHNCVDDATRVVVLAVTQHGRCTLDCIRRIASKVPPASILVMTDLENTALASRALKAGAKGYLTKMSTPEMLKDAICELAAGRIFIDPWMAQRLSMQKATGERGPFDALTAREFEVMLMLVENLSRDEIAKLLHVSPKTVSNHHANLIRKLGIKSEAGLARLAISHGVVSN